ncbi:hypothetical protein AAHV46_26645 (plasmid) [Klebsiella pneumoniae]|nr:hypothetical protein [Klebsiella pneumoniae]
MAGALFSLSAGGVIFATSVIIIILSAMLYDSIKMVVGDSLITLMDIHSINPEARLRK